MNLPEPTRDDLRDEISALTAHLIARHGMTAQGVRRVARNALKTGKARTIQPRGELRIASVDELLQDLELALIALSALGNVRMAMSAITRGVKLAVE